MRDQNVSQRKIAEIMGVTQQAIWHICRKKSWCAWIVSIFSNYIESYAFIKLFWRISGCKSR
jgi:predicted XRE-type DNA-binding protein